MKMIEKNNSVIRTFYLNFEIFNMNAYSFVAHSVRLPQIWIVIIVCFATMNHGQKTKRIILKKQNESF